jgi:hypothetical protein
MIALCFLLIVMALSAAAFSPASMRVYNRIQTKLEADKLAGVAAVGDTVASLLGAVTPVVYILYG